MEPITFFRKDVVDRELKLLDPLFNTAVNVHSLEVLIYVEGSGSYVDHFFTKLSLISARPSSFVNEVFRGRSPAGLYRVDDTTDLSDTLFEAVGYGFGALMAVQEEVVDDVVLAAQQGSLEIQLGSEPSSLPDIVGTRTPYIELQTCGEYDDLLAATWSADLPADLQSILSEIGSGKLAIKPLCEKCGEPLRVADIKLCVECGWRKEE